jgi:hypothetical protein
MPISGIVKVTTSSNQTEQIGKTEDAPIVFLKVAEEYSNYRAYDSG